MWLCHGSFLPNWNDLQMQAQKLLSPIVRYSQGRCRGALRSMGYYGLGGNHYIDVAVVYHALQATMATIDIYGFNTTNYGLLYPKTGFADVGFLLTIISKIWIFLDLLSY